MTDDLQIGEWNQGPLHLFVQKTLHVVTACTLHKQHIFTTPEKLRLSPATLFETARAHQGDLQAWALFSHHYHNIARSPAEGSSLKHMIQRLHPQGARLVSEVENTPGRRVWFQYWDTCLTFERSYYARLNYVHSNPVKHRLFRVAEEHQLCSARWFKSQAPEDFRREGFGYDGVHVPDIEC